MKFLTDLEIEQGCELYLRGTQNLATDPDKYLGLDANNRVIYRTGTQLLSDLDLAVGVKLLPAGTQGQMLCNIAGTWTAFSGMSWDYGNSRLQVGTLPQPLYESTPSTVTLVGSNTFLPGSVSTGTRIATLAIVDELNSYTTLGSGGGILFGGKYTSSYCQLGAGIKGVRESIGAGVDNWGLAFYTSFDNNLLNEVVRISNLGYFGIANASPGELLTLGTAGVMAGKMSFAGATSGKAILQVSAIAGTPTLTLPTISGTLALTSNISAQVYPGAGIAVSTGSAWGTSITDSSGNWNTAYSWGNHASAGYGLASALTTHAALTTTAHGLGASAFHADAYFALSGHNHDSAYATTTHAHGNILNTGAIGTTANLPIITGNGGVLQAGSWGTGAYTFVHGNDSRLSDARVSNIAAGAAGNLMISTGSVWSSAAPPTWNQNTTGTAAKATTVALTDALTAPGTYYLVMAANAASGGLLIEPTKLSFVQSTGLLSSTKFAGEWIGTAIADAYISSAVTWNAKQAALNGTGFVKISGTTISYDNSTYVTGTPWTSMGYVTGTPWTSMGYVTGTPWTSMGYVTGTPWTSMGYLTSQISHADVLVDGDFSSQGIMLRGASAGSYTILTNNSATWNAAAPKADPVFTGSMGFDGTSGAHSNFVIKKAGSVGASNVSYTFSHRANGEDFFIYAYDGSTFKNWFDFDWSADTNTFYGSSILSGIGDYSIGANLPSLRYLSFGALNGSQGKIYWNGSQMVYASSNYHSFGDGTNMQFSTTATGVNIPAGKTYQINGVSVAALSRATYEEVNSGIENNKYISPNALANSKYADDGIQTLANKTIVPRLKTFDATGTPGYYFLMHDYDIAYLYNIDLDFLIMSSYGLYHGQLFVFQIKDSGTSKNISFDTGFNTFKPSFPTATVPNKYLYFTCRWNATTSKWDVIDFAIQN